GDAACGAGGRGIECVNRRLWPDAVEPGAARVARRQCRCPPRQPQLGRCRYDVRPARFWPRTERAILTKPSLRGATRRSNLDDGSVISMRLLRCARNDTGGKE